MNLTTISLWLLISIGESGGGASQPTMVVERFATAQECQRVLKVVQDRADGYRQPKLVCAQATVVSK